MLNANTQRMKSIVDIRVIIKHKNPDDAIQTIVADALIEHGNFLKEAHFNIDKESVGGGTIGRVGTQWISPNIKIVWECQRNISNASPQRR